MRSKKGNLNLVIGLVFGITTLIIGVIIMFTIVSTLTGANLLTSTRTTGTVTNETGAWLNKTTYNLKEGSSSRFGYTITAIFGSYNQSTDIGNTPAGYNVSIPVANATVSGYGVTNLSTWTEGYTNVSLSYTYTGYSAEENSTNRLTGNLTSGVDNVSGKIPTVLLVAAIILVLAILALLVGAWQKMKAGGGI